MYVSKVIMAFQFEKEKHYYSNQISIIRLHCTINHDLENVTSNILEGSDKITVKCMAVHKDVK
jgi:coenzyme F420-reducing hydrogenase delta subunit